MINQQIIERLIAYRERDCVGCTSNSNSQKYHTCTVYLFDDVNYFLVISDLLQENLISLGQYLYLSELTLETFEDGTSTSELFKNQK